MQWKNCITELHRTRWLFQQAARKFDVKFPYSMTTDNKNYVNFLRAPYTLYTPRANFVYESLIVALQLHHHV
jgi:hypothetical protein